MKVTLKKPHTHAGEYLQAGAEIDVTEHEAAFLMEHGVIDDLPPAKPKATDSKVK